MLRGASPELIIVLAIILLVAFPFHEFSHALAAYRLGDGTAKLFGRLTLNPIVHFDPVGGLALIITGLFGWAKPTPVNPYNLRGGRTSEAIVAAAGPVSNLVLAVAAAIPLRYILATKADVPFEIAVILLLFIEINVGLFLFNLIPIPPLDGSKVLFAFLNPRLVYQYRPVLEQYGFLLIILAILPLGPSGSILSGIYEAIATPLIGLLIGQPVSI
jgi:Zn-dependent protease